MAAKNNWAVGDRYAASDANALADEVNAKSDKLASVNSQTGTAYTLVLGDADKIIEASNASAITITVPTNASVAFPIGTTIGVTQIGAGQVTLAGAGVTLVSAGGLSTRAQYSSVILRKQATNTWILSGDLSSDILVANYATLQEAADAAAGKRLVFPSGQTYTLTDSSISIPAGCYVEGNGSTLKFPNNTDLFEIVFADSDVTIDGLNFDGNGSNQSVWSEYRMCVKIIDDVDNVTIKNCDFTNLIGDGVYISTQTHGGHVIGPYNTFTSNYDARNGVSVVSGDTIEIHHNTFTTISRTDMPGHIDIEPDNPTDHCEHIEIHHNTFVGGATAPTPGTCSGIVVSGHPGNSPINDVYVHHNDISGNRFTFGVLVTGTDITSTSDAFNPARGIVIDSNTIHDLNANGRGVEVDYWIKANVTNNVFTNMLFGVLVYYACLENSGGNTYTNCTGADLDIYNNEPRCFVGPVSYVSSASAATTSVAMPSHAVNDLIVAFAYRNDAATAPALPSGWTSINSGTSGTNGSRLAYKIAASSSETSGTWTNATGLVIHVYRGAMPGASAVNRANSSTITYPALTLNNTNSSSYVARFAGHRTATNLTTNTPAGYTQRQGIATAVRGLDTNGTVASNPTAATQSVDATSDFCAYTFEVKSASEL